MSITIQTGSGHIQTTLRELVLAVASESSCSAEAQAVLQNMIAEGRVHFGPPGPPESVAIGAPAIGA